MEFTNVSFLLQNFLKVFFRFDALFLSAPPPFFLRQVEYMYLTGFNSGDCTVYKRIGYIVRIYSPLYGQRVLGLSHVRGKMYYQFLINRLFLVSSLSECLSVGV